MWTRLFRLAFVASVLASGCGRNEPGRLAPGEPPTTNGPDDEKGRDQKHRAELSDLRRQNADLKVRIFELKVKDNPSNEPTIRKLEALRKEFRRPRC